MYKYNTIDSDEKLKQYIEYLKKNNLLSIGMDFEGEFNLHIYGEHLCLIQIFDTEGFILLILLKLVLKALKNF